MNEPSAAVPTPAEIPQRAPRGRRGNPGRMLAVIMTATFTLAALATSAGAAHAAVAGHAAKPAASAAPAWHNGGCGQLPTVRVQATGIPVQDRSDLQLAVDTAQAEHGCALLIGHFNLGKCLLCVRITAPVTVSGLVDPNQDPNSSNNTVVSTTGGEGSFLVNEPSTAPAGTIEFTDIWISRVTTFGFLMANVYNGNVKFLDNRVTNIRGGVFRVGIGGSGEIPIVAPLQRSMTGQFIAEGNYINTLAVPFPTGGDDNGIAFQGTRFTTMNFLNNTVITRGESLEIEKSVGQTYRIIGNTVVSRYRRNSPFAEAVVTVGYPRLHGGHPAALKLAGNDVANFYILDNNITAGGGSNTLICIMQFMSETSIHRHRFNVISGNHCTTKGIFADLLGGWSGERPYFPQGTLDDAVVTDNTFSGTADFGITMMDFRVPAAPSNNLVNTSHGDLLACNNLSDFTAIKGGANLYFGPSTYDNTFIGNPHGPVVNLGTNNRVIITGKRCSTRWPAP